MAYTLGQTRPIQAEREKKEFSGKLVKPLSANPTKLSNTLKQFVDKFPSSFLSLFDHFVGLALKGLSCSSKNHP